MSPRIDPNLTASDIVLLQNLSQDLEDFKRTAPAKDAGDARKRHAFVTDSEVTGADEHSPVFVPSKARDGAALTYLKALNDPKSRDFQPTILTTWNSDEVPQWLQTYILAPWSQFAQRIVRNPTDVVFLTHIAMYICTIVPSALYLFFGHFTYLHAVLHTIYAMWCAGPFTLMLHNHIHNGGVLRKDNAWIRWFDWSFPYVLEPLMGHTWDSYFYHHVKHHHVEGNGPDDLSSTVRYQRDDIWHFAHYTGRFLVLIWIDLPMYFLRKNRPTLAARAFVSELSSYAFFATMMYLAPKPATFVIIIPFCLLRVGLMVGNWGQHALVDELEPDSDFRSAITLIDVPSNRFSFNDGYHISHHLNPLRHWREHPVHFMQSKAAYRDGRALVFCDIDYIMLTIKLLSKDYTYIAERMVPISQEQADKSVKEREEMLRTKTRKFSEEEIAAKWS